MFYTNRNIFVCFNDTIMGEIVVIRVMIKMALFSHFIVIN